MIIKNKFWDIYSSNCLLFKSVLNEELKKYSNKVKKTQARIHLLKLIYVMAAI